MATYTCPDCFEGRTNDFCRVCDGSGTLSSEDYIDCITCEGTGLELCDVCKGNWDKFPDAQTETIALIGIVRRWKKKEGGGLIIVFPEVACSVSNPYLIDSYMERDGGGCADWNVMLDKTRMTEYDDEEVLAFIIRYERYANCKITLRKRNTYARSLEKSWKGRK